MVAGGEAVQRRRLLAAPLLSLAVLAIKRQPHSSIWLKMASVYQRKFLIGQTLRPRQTSTLSLYSLISSGLSIILH
uniref:Calcium channel n=1 Tax=Rhizophora mucronata TaxID=61149 RepID=A0A2P2LHY3_RHIMU